MILKNKNQISYDDYFDVVVIGAGHAGCEAGLISSRMGHKTAMFCTDIESVAMMPCNPSIGGTGKGHLVKEIDALGGEMGINTDKTFIQSKMLNTSKGPAVHSLRAQADKHKYHAEMLSTIEKQDKLSIFVDEINDFVLEDCDNMCNSDVDNINIVKNYIDNNKSIRLVGVVTKSGKKIEASAAVVCTGTFLGGKIFIGDDITISGPAGLPPATELAENMSKLGFPLRRFKTGTPARMLRDTLDYSKMKEQKGDDEIVPFSFMNESIDYDIEQVSCWLSYTNQNTHKIILDNIEKSALYGGSIVGVGPRYCPSIEDKIARFKDRERHQLFVEPEGIDTDWMYIQGMSSSLPFDVQKEFYSTIPGLENAEIVSPAYAIEYDCIDPLSLKSSLENKYIEGLFCAGQFNGSSGYEEAAAQGLIAGINAVCKLENREPLVIGRDQGYIGVLIDDLVTKGTNEPYRMMTSRAEYRLLLRQDNADRRLTEIGYKWGTVSDERYKVYLDKKNRVDKEIERLKKTKPEYEKLKEFLYKFECDIYAEGLKEEAIERRRKDIEKSENMYLTDILRRPGYKYDDLAEIDPCEERPHLTRNDKTEIEVIVKYDGYIRKQFNEVEKLKNLESKKLKDSIDYNEIRGLRLEARQKLNQIKPSTVGQASRISGVSPADVNVLLVYLEKEFRSNNG